MSYHQPVTCWKSKREQNPCFFQCGRDDKNRSFRHWKNSNENKHTRRNTSLQKISILDAINTKNIRKLLIKNCYLLTFSYISLDGWSVQSEYLFPSRSNTLCFYFVFALICQGINAIRLGHKKLHMVHWDVFNVIIKDSNSTSRLKYWGTFYIFGYT